MNHSLPLSDAKDIVSLLGEVIILPGGIDVQKRHLMNGLARLIDADSWAWATTFSFESDEVPLNAGFITEGFSADQFAKYQEALEHPDTAILNEGFTREFQAKKTHLTRLREQIDTRGYFLSSAVYPIWIDAGVEQVIQSVYPTADGVLSHIGLYRRPGRAPFMERESRIAHILLSEVPWLHQNVLPGQLGSTVVSLSPRQRITLNLLLDGQSRSEIAAHLGLSLATVGEYVKAVFRHFNVHSQPELIARFRQGDGGDLAVGTLSPAPTP